MALSGYQGVDIPINVKMAGVINDTYTVAFGTPAFGSIDHASFTFNNGNWNVDQVLKLNCTAPGPCNIPVKITAPYQPSKDLETVITVTILPLPLDSWVGSVPVWYDGGAGDLSISHNNLVAGHRCVINLPSWTGIGADAPFLLPSNCTILIDLPDGSHTSVAVSGLGSGINYSMTMLGIYRFRIAMTPCWIMGYNVGTGHTVQATVFSYEITDSSGTILLGPINTGLIKSQGAATSNTNTGFAINDTPRHPDGPFTETVPSVYDENTFILPIDIHTGSGGLVQSNCTGGFVNGAGVSVNMGATRTNFPFAVSLNRGSMEVWNDGHDTGIRFGAGYNN